MFCFFASSAHVTTSSLGQAWSSMQAKTSLEDLHLSRLLSRPPGSLQGPVLGFLAQKVIAGAGTPCVSFLLSIVSTSPSKYLNDLFNLNLVFFFIDAEAPPEAWQAKVGEEYDAEGERQDSCPLVHDHQLRILEHHEQIPDCDDNMKSSAPGGISFGC